MNNLIKKITLLVFFEILIYVVVKVAIYDIYLREQLDIVEKIKLENVPLFLEVFFVSFIFVSCILIFRKVFFSLVLTLILYLFFLITTLEKIKFLGAPLYWVDLTQIDDLLATKGLIIDYLIPVLVLIFIFSYICYILYKAEPLFIKSKKIILFLTIYSILIICFTVFRGEFLITLKSQNSYFRLNPDYPIRLGFRLGYLNNFIQTAVFNTNIQKPDYYSCNTIGEIYKGMPIPEKNNSLKRVNIIIIMAEAFTDLKDSGLVISPEAQPAFRDIRENHGFGYIISPVYGGKSVNAEFELLTGFSMKFIPLGTIPYRELIQNKIFSITNLLKGMEKTAIQVVKTTNYGYSKIYDYLSFDKVISLHNSGYELDPSKKYTSSAGLAKKIIEVESTQQQSFIFAFPNSSHAPWAIEDYSDYNYDVKNKDGINISNNIISGYIGAMNHIDKLLEILMDYYEDLDENTIIMIIGDHQPANSEYTNLLKNEYLLNPSFSKLSNNALKYIVPMGIWSNFGALNKKDYPLISMNLIQVLLFDIFKINPTGYHALLENLYKQTKIISPYINKTYLEASSSITIFKLLQYDQISGKNYISKFINDPSYNCNN